jgi:hypothetical protein
MLFSEASETSETRRKEVKRTLVFCRRDSGQDGGEKIGINAYAKSPKVKSQLRGAYYAGLVNQKGDPPVGRTPIEEGGGAL